MIHQIVKGLKKTRGKTCISKRKPYINQYNRTGIKFPSGKEEWKKFEQNNKEVALNILFVRHNKKEIEPAYTPKYNYKRKNKLFC